MTKNYIEIYLIDYQYIMQKYEKSDEKSDEKSKLFVKM